MNIKNKKAGTKRTISFIIGMIGVIFAGIILLFVVGNFALNSFFEEEACLRSVQFRGLGAKMPFGVCKGLFPLNCKTNEVDITSHNTEEIKKQIVDELYDSWYRLGQGQYNFLNTRPYLATYPGSEGGECAISSTIFFDESIKGKLIENLDIYLLKEKVPTKDYSYHKFFTHEYEVEEGKTITYEIYAQDSFETKDYLLIYLTFGGYKDYMIFRDRVRYWSFGLEPYSFEGGTEKQIKGDECEKQFSNIPFAVFLERNPPKTYKGDKYSVVEYEFKEIIDYTMFILLPFENFDTDSDYSKVFGGDLPQHCLSLQSLP